MDSAARRKVFGQSRSISPRRCSVSALSVAARETSHLEANASTAIPRGWVFVRAPAPVLCAIAPACAADRPSLFFGPLQPWEQKQKNPRAVVDASRVLSPRYPPAFAEAGKNCFVLPTTAHGRNFTPG